MSVPSGGNHKQPHRGGRDLGVPQVLTYHQITGPLMVGHTADYAAPEAPIVVREADTVRPGPAGTGYLDARCRHCAAKPYLALGEDQALLVLQHEEGCRELAALLRQAGAGR